MEENAKKMFEILKGYFGQTLKCVCVNNGHIQTIEGVFHGLDDFLSISIGSNGIPLIGLSMAVISISCGDRVLYFNPYITKEYKGYDGEMERISQAFFGDGKKKAEEAILRGDKPVKSDAEIIAGYDVAINAYIREGKSHIQDEDLKNAWEETCRNAVGNRRKIEIVKIANVILRTLAEGKTMDEIVERVKRQFQPNDEQLVWSIRTAAMHSSHCEEMLRYLREVIYPELTQVIKNPDSPSGPNM